ncbi:MAG: AAA family ATPase, partial [Cetobacterium sp.]
MSSKKKASTFNNKVLKLQVKANLKTVIKNLNTGLAMKEKLKMLIENLNTGLIGKEDVIKISLLSILAQENLILFGPPGTAKSEISRRISSVIDGENYFEYLLTKFTTPEEIFGPLSIKELKEDRFYRKTEGYLPTVQIGFLDEIFKANSSILNTLLTIMNEKVFHNGNEKEDTNLISLIGASNEDPSNDLELNALYDRFLIRKVVDYVKDDELNKFFDISSEP